MKSLEAAYIGSIFYSYLEVSRRLKADYDNGREYLANISRGSTTIL